MRAAASHPAEDPVVQVYFYGRVLTAQDFSADQQAAVPHHAGAGCAAAPDSLGHDAATPLETPPQGSIPNEALLRSLPVGFLETVALNPQPLPPREHPLAAQLPTGQQQDPRADRTTIAAKTRMHLFDVLKSIVDRYDQSARNVLKAMRK
jgi:hypothetical protein